MISEHGLSIFCQGKRGIPVSRQKTIGCLYVARAEVRSRLTRSRRRRRLQIGRHQRKRLRLRLRVKHTISHRARYNRVSMPGLHVHV